ncbi:PorT family protein [Bacteroides sp. 214]|uniref:type IX secretion/gliding motility protein PorT/SprT n=1 Tax=Bacteroides sp. 214 TaxID=2302935 RepID=UPI0013D6383F|nr:PorT family protein [Bacteroides sp. 214]
MKRVLFITLTILLATCAFAQKRKVQNRPYIDQRKFHYGFLIGMHTQDLQLVNNGFITADGQTWFADTPEYSPGFNIGVLGEFYLTNHLAFRVIPSLYFGDKTVVFKEQATGEVHRQQIKSSYISVPLNLKFSSERFNNYRPYLMAGINPVYDLGVKRRNALLMKSVDCYIELGLGCDFYLPFFKFIPELKFCFGLSNLIDKDRTDLTDLSLLKFTESVDKGKSRMIVLTFYFE